MQITWSRPAGEDLSGLAESPAWQEFHEASKLPAAIARSLAGTFAPSPLDAFVAGRAFRQSPGPSSVLLPEPAPVPADLDQVMRGRRSSQELSGPLALADLSTVLSQALGITRLVHDEQTGIATAYRAWPSAGALYPIETYLLARSVPGLAPGCYHVNVLTRELEPTGSTGVDDAFTAGFFWQDFALTAAAVIVLAAVFERTVAKYGERGYRFALLDAGHAGQNLLLVAEQQRLAAVAVGGFDDDALSAALGLDGLHEACVHTVFLGGRP